MNRLRITLLSKIIASTGIFTNKYSESLKILEAVMHIEEKETRDRLPNSIFKKFKQIKEKSNLLLGKKYPIPLLILEEYLFSNIEKGLEGFVYINYNDYDYEIKVYELLSILEDFFKEIFLLAVEIADVYNLEIKLKNISREDKVL